MERRNSLVLWAVAGGLLVGGFTLMLRGWTVAGAHAAARNTARYTLLWFVVAFAAPGLCKLFRALPSGGALTKAYVGAHLVHFAMVAALIASFESAHLFRSPGRSAAIILVGSLLVLTAGATSNSSSRRLGSALNSYALYAIFLIFLLAFVHNRVAPLRLLVLPLLAALALRISAKALPSSPRRYSKAA
jgi:hypothetical protein